MMPMFENLHKSYKTAYVKYIRSLYCDEMRFLSLNGEFGKIFEIFCKKKVILVEQGPLCIY